MLHAFKPTTRTNRFLSTNKIFATWNDKQLWTWFIREFYTIEELQCKTTPQGVDPTKLEKYLSDEDFEVWFKTFSDYNNGRG